MSKRYKLTEKQLHQLEILAAGQTLEEIAKSFGISERTLIRIKEHQPEAQQAWETGRARSHAFVVSKLMELIRAGDKASIMFYLKCQCGWRETQSFDLKSSDGSMSPVKSEPKYDLSKLSDQCLKELANAAEIAIKD